MAVFIGHWFLLSVSWSGRQRQETWELHPLATSLPVNFVCHQCTPGPPGPEACQRLQIDGRYAHSLFMPSWASLHKDLVLVGCSPGSRAKLSDLF